MRAFVMAAGKGTRLAPLTDCLPKPSIPVANEPAMGFLLRLLARYGYRDVASNISYKADQMQQIFGDGSAYGVNLTWSVETELLGTAGGMKKLESFLRQGDEPVLVLSGDGVHDVDLAEVVRTHRESNAFATLVLLPVPDPSEYGVAIVGEDGLISGFQEKPAPGTELSNLSNTGIYVFDPAIFDLIAPATFADFGSELIPQLVEEGKRVVGVVHKGYWNDIGGLDAFREGNFAMLDGRLDLLGDRAEDEWPTDVLVHPSAQLAVDVTLIGPCVIGADSKIGSGVRIARSVVLPGSVVPDGTMLAAATFGTYDGLLRWSESWADVSSPTSV